MANPVDTTARLGSAPTRVEAFDLARGLAMLFMVMVHVQMIYGTAEVQDSPFGWVVEFLGSPPAAPVFMFLMGLSTAFSARASLAKGLRRGGELFALGYALNFIRGSLPAFLALKTGLLSREDLGAETPLSLFLEVDILQFAGIALVALALCRRFVPKPAAWIALASVLMLVSPMLWGRTTDQPLMHWFLSHFWGAEEHVAFPAFPWLCYPLIGMACGRWFIAANDPGRFFRRGLVAGLILLAIGTGVILTNPDFHIGDYYHSGPGAVLWILGFVLVWLWACQLVTRRIPPNPAFRLLYFWSQRVTVFYFIHWVLIGWGVGLFGEEERGLVATILLIGLIALVADQSTRLWVRMRHGKREATTPSSE